MTRTAKLTRILTSTPRISRLAAGILMACASVPAAYAVDFDTESFEGTFDSTLSTGAGWRIEEVDENKVGIANGGKSWSTNNDDGNLNFHKGDAFTRVVKGLFEFDLRQKDGSYGFFTRGTFLKDYELADDDRRFKELNDEDIERQSDDARMLDTYLWANFEPLGKRLQLRIGEQVFNWGESTLIGHSIAEANAIDLGKLRVPGAELKEAFIPAKAVWGSLQVTDNVALEAYAQFEWEPVRFDSPGTFLSTQDFIGDTRAWGTTCEGEFGVVHLLFGQMIESTPATQLCRMADREPSDEGQGGVKLSWFAEDFGETDFGFYFVNYHNKRPLISAYAFGAGAPNGEAVTGFVEYPEDIQLYGISFNTTVLGGLAIGGEVSLRKDEPLQIDDVELLFAALQPSGRIQDGTSQLGGGIPQESEISGYRLIDTYQMQVTFTQLFQGFMGADQFTFLAEVGANIIPDLPSQDELRFEVAGTYRSGNAQRAGNGIGFAAGNVGIDLNNNGVISADEYIATDFDVNVDADGDGNPSNDIDSTCIQMVGPAKRQCEGVETNEFATSNSWGYRLIGRWEYANALFGWNVTPRLIFQHDVSGYTPAPISNFIEGRMSATFGVSFDYLNRWRVDVSGSSFFGNDEQDPLSDRDFASLVISYSI